MRRATGEKPCQRPSRREQAGAHTWAKAAPPGEAGSPELVEEMLLDSLAPDMDFISLFQTSCAPALHGHPPVLSMAGV